MPNPLLYVCSAEKGRSLYVIASAIPENYPTLEAQESVRRLIKKFDITPQDETFELYVEEEKFEAGICGSYVRSLGTEYLTEYLATLTRQLAKNRGWRFGSSTPIAFADSITEKQYHKNFSQAIFNSTYSDRWAQGTLAESIPS